MVLIDPFDERYRRVDTSQLRAVPSFCSKSSLVGADSVRLALEGPRPLPSGLVIMTGPKGNLLTTARKIQTTVYFPCYCPPSEFREPVPFDDT